MLKIALTGHRPNKLAGYKTNPVATYIYRWIAIQLVKLLKENEKIECISGMALGCDTIFAAVTMLLKQKYPDDVKLTVALPYEDHGSNWPDVSKKYHDKIVKSADTIELVCSGSYSNWKLLKRDEWMVDHCDVLLAIWNGKKDGGTWHTIKYAQSKNKPIIFINEKKLNSFVDVANKIEESK